jgi:hypothetical protein
MYKIEGVKVVRRLKRERNMGFCTNIKQFGENGGLTKSS